MCFILIYLRFTRRSNAFFILLWAILFVLLGTFAYFTDDYYAYVDTIDEAYINPLAQFHIEPIWIWLSEVVRGDIDEFRFITFFIISILLYLIIRSAKVDLKYFFVYYTFFCLNDTLCWVRQPVAMCFSLCGILFMCNKRYILSVIFLFLSCFLHKIGIICLLILPACLFSINKKLIWIYILSIPLMCIFFYLILNASSEFSTVVSMQHYAQGDGEFASRHIIFKLFSIVSILFQFFFLIYTVYRFHENEDKYVKILVRYILIVLVVSIFLFALPLSTGVFVKRLLYFGLMMMAIVWAKCIQKNLLLKKNVIMFILLLMYISLQLTVTLAQNYTRIGERLLRMPW